MFNKIIRRMWKPLALGLMVALVVTLSPVGLQFNNPPQDVSSPDLSLGQYQMVLTIGTDVYASGVADYTCDGVDDNVQFQAALDALPVGGGKLVVLTGDYSFTATVLRAIDDVTIEGMGDSTYFAYDAGTALFDAGTQDGWVFRNFRTDAGGVDVDSTTDYVITNVTVGTDVIGKITRTATFTVAASDSYASSKAQADYVCSGANDHVEIQAALDALPATGGCIYLPEGTYTLGAQVLRAIDDVKFMGSGQATLLNLDGGTAVITAGTQDGWLFAYFATDAGGPNIAGATQSAIRSVWIAGVRTDDPVAAAGGDAVITVAADNTPAAQKDRADFVCSGANDDATIEALVAAGVTMKLMVGDYTFGASLDILVSNFRLEGSGWGTVISGVVAVPYIRIGDNATYIENITICDLRIDASSQTNGFGIHCDGGSAANRLENINILNCRIESTNDDAIKAEYTYNSLFAENYFETTGKGGFYLEYSYHNRIVDNYFYQVNFYPIYLRYADFNTVTENIIRDSPNLAMTISESNYNVISFNIMLDGDSEGIHVGANASYNTIIGNTGTNNALELIVVTDSPHNTISGNVAEGCTGAEGIWVMSDFCTITGNVCRNNGRHGILARGDHLTVVGNNIYESGMLTDVTYNGIEVRGNYILVEANTVRMGTLANQPAYGIHITADSTHCTVRNNDLYDSGLTGPILDEGLDTKFNNITFQFVQGTTFISATGSAKGWEIDLANEFAIALGQLPLELTQVVRIKIWAVGLAAPGAGNQMTLDINMNAGQDDEAYTAEAVVIVDKLNTTENFAIGDVIHWVLTSADDANIGTLAGGDSLEIQVLFKAGTPTDIDTDAVFRAVEIEYVP